MATADSHAISWAAGLFEGEGCVGMSRIARPKRSKTPKLQLCMTDKDVVDRFRAVMGMGNVTTWKNPRLTHLKRSYSWHVTSFEKVQAIIAMFWPWLGARRRQRATEILLEARSQPILARHRKHCPKGHDLSGKNLYILPSRGVRACRACLYEAARRWRAKPGVSEQLNIKRRAWRRRREEESAHGQHV